MEARALNYNTLSKQILSGIDYKNYTDFHSLKLVLRKLNHNLSNIDINKILDYLRNELAIYCDADLADITEDEINVLRDLIFK